jgi:hypothetical protein
MRRASVGAVPLPVRIALWPNARATEGMAMAIAIGDQITKNAVVGSVLFVGDGGGGKCSPKITPTCFGIRRTPA